MRPKRAPRTAVTQAARVATDRAHSFGNLPAHRLPDRSRRNRSLGKAWISATCRLPERSSGNPGVSLPAATIGWVLTHRSQTLAAVTIGWVLTHREPNARRSAYGGSSPTGAERSPQCIGWVLTHRSRTLAAVALRWGLVAESRTAPDVSIRHQLNARMRDFGGSRPTLWIAQGPPVVHRGRGHGMRLCFAGDFAGVWRGEGCAFLRVRAERRRDGLWRRCATLCARGGEVRECRPAGAHANASAQPSSLAGPATAGVQGR